MLVLASRRLEVIGSPQVTVRQAQPEDLVTIYVASHGSPDPSRPENLYKRRDITFRDYMRNEVLRNLFVGAVRNNDSFPAQVTLTGRKETQKIYRRHSGFEGGLREERATVVRKRQPIRMVEEAVRGMLPKTKMGDAMYRKLKVYAGADHPHAAQQPTSIEVA